VNPYSNNSKIVITGAFSRVYKQTGHGRFALPIINNRFDHRKTGMSRNEVKNVEKNKWGLLSKCPLSGQVTAGI
jgi:hypothetical protein